MKFKFKTQSFQTEATESIIKVFEGQPRQEMFKYRRDLGSRNAQSTIDEHNDEFETGYRNSEILISKEKLLKNIQSVQTYNNINNSNIIESGLGAVSLDIEMETGTGKTYVYIKTMFELYKAYGWSKFIIVVPSLAIREGVKKSFEITQDHFMEMYGIKARFFVYNSSDLHKLDDFSQNSGINVMIINTQAFNTSMNEEKNVEGRKGNEVARIIYSYRDDFGSRRPIDVIKENRPIIILDEPQKMGGQATQNALKKNFNPLFSINFSATHVKLHNLVYVLDALDAFKKKIVKKIEVKGFELRNLSGTNRYIYFDSVVINNKIPPRARLEFEVKQENGIKRKIRLLGVGDNLYSESNNLEEYRGLSIAEIDPIQSKIIFSNGETLTTGEACGNVNESDIRRIQIRETIASHFDKEEKLFEQGIKCLSLFFIDEVSKYRKYDEEGNALLGEYGKIFEEEYNAILEEKREFFSVDYQRYLSAILNTTTHSGYFSIDKNKAVNSQVKRGSEYSDDITAYDLILKNKELLLSFEEPTRFIFSHSALREGWDNPNVFQICSLKHTDNAIIKRQEVGRGLRLCVNELGDRQDIEACGEENVHGLNVLTVVASESYASFVKGLQNEILNDLYERPTKVSIDYFAQKNFMIGDIKHTITVSEATAIYNYLVRNNYVDDQGVVTDDYLFVVEQEKFAPMKPELQKFSGYIHKLIQSVYNPDIVTKMAANAHVTKIKENPINANWKDFQELWKRINKKYAYTVSFNSAELIDKSIIAINSDLNVAKLTYLLTRGEQIGSEFKVEQTSTTKLDRFNGSQIQYDLVGKISEATTLTRKSVVKILANIKKEKLSLFEENPEEFIVKIASIIHRQKASVVVEHIKYEQSAEEPYTQNIFNLSRNSEEFNKAFRAKRAIQDYIFTDGYATKSVERRFVEDLDTADEVIVYAKLPSGPRGFYIPTPMGRYTPDWAITFKKGTVKHIFFIAETKGSLDSLQLAPIEKAKIDCAKKLFNELSSSEIKYHDVVSYENLLSIIDTL